MQRFTRGIMISSRKGDRIMLATIVGSVLLVSVLAGCKSGMPPPRMEAYLGPAVEKGEATNIGDVALPGAGGQTGLIVINDTTAPGSAPALSEETIIGLANVLRHRIEKTVPLKIVKAVQGDGLTPRQNRGQLLQLAEREGFEYVVLAIFSSTEWEAPTYLSFSGVFNPGGSSDNNPGFETDNFARVELALLHGTGGQVLVQADGQAWATLYRLNVTQKSNVYPVVFRQQQQNPIYPESDDNAHDVLRGVSADDAMNQALMKFQEAWNQRVPR